ncbi:MAG: uroporphyrin-III methyltransferase [Candidatus Nitrosocaldaceae archaeon]|nr:MAG: uroporphyrin-III methyltransferase [Candidatus Nitrosocaldaceae archaeon]
MNIFRVYDKLDGNYRILVDRLWPRGVSKDRSMVKRYSASNGLRRWFNHREDRWGEFKERYFKELDNKEDLVNIIIDKARDSDITLLYSAKSKYNNAIALKEYIENLSKI